MLRVRLCASMVCAIVAVSASHAAAATITVNTTADDSSAGDGFCSLRKAIADVDAPGSNSGDCAPAAFGTNTIQLGPHTYTLFGTAGGGDSALEVTSSVTDLTITGSGAGTTQIEAGGSGARVLTVDSGATVTLSQLTLSGGHAPDGTMGAPGVGTSAGGAG